MEQTILSNLLYNEEYTRKVIPFLKTEYFKSPTNQVIFDLIKFYVDKYNLLPTKEILLVDLETKSGVSETQIKEVKKFIDGLDGELQNLNWLVDKTEAFCQEAAVYNAMVEALDIINDKSGKRPKGIVPDLLRDALSLSFDVSLGHDYFEDADARFAFYHDEAKRIRFDIELLNFITKNGVPNKTLTVLAGAVGFGKTAMMCHFAGANILDGKNVLFISMEMSKELIGERIDANLLDVPLDDMRKIPKEMFDARISKVKSRAPGRLIIEEFPEGQAGVPHFRHLLYELKIKRNFVPDIIYIDYINICASSKARINAPLMKE